MAPAHVAPRTRVPVGLLGATGMVGQQFVRALDGHPWFDLVWLGASSRSAGRPYREAAHWLGEGGIPDAVGDIVVERAVPGACPSLVFSAMDASVAGGIEREFARAGHIVVSNSRNHRMEPDVPLLIPEINPSHLELIPKQRRGRGWTGAIVTNPNCSTIGLALALAPLRRLGIESFVATTMQALSGAGHPGVPSLDILGNVVPEISGEEEKIATETLKILGELRGGAVEPLAVNASAHCNRVPVVDGHMICVSVKLAEESAPREVAARMSEFVALVHNTVRGAAGASVLNAELMLAEGWLDG